jgi:hypothetical protein
VTPDPDRGTSPDPIEAMAAALAASNPGLYRHVALYLQVLRQVLPARVEQACFHLATQVHPQRYAALATRERQLLHGRILALVQRCSSLLTVEQLAALADQMDREAQHQQRRRQRQLLESLSGDGADAVTVGDEMSPEHAGTDPSPEQGGGDGVQGLPAGSIRLDFSLPLSTDIGGWRPLAPPTGPSAAPGIPNAPLGQDQPRSGQPGADSQSSVQQPSAKAGSSPQDAGGEAEAKHDELTEDPGADDTVLDSEADGEHGLDAAFGDLIAMAESGSPYASEAAEPPIESLQERLAQGPDTAEILRIVREAMEESGDPMRQAPLGSGAGPSSPWREARLPRDPVTLLRWLDGLEKALLRRLRNLSHALNVELLRVGISRGLLPVSLLDAVLEGQIDTMAAPSNVLHLQMPFSLRPGTAEVHAMAILLRPVDLEMDEPRLRTCRRRLQQQRQELRRMAHQFRRLQRRLQAHEAERLWLQDIRNSPPPQS